MFPLKELPVYEQTLSRVNGPGLRCVVWIEGCPFGCDGCFNAHLQNPSSRHPVSIEELASVINGMHKIEGVTLSGGEPLLYPEAVSGLFELLRPELTQIIFTGFTYNEIRSSDILTKTIMGADLVIAGRYDRNLANPYFGKEFICVSKRVRLDWFKPVNTLEYDIAPSGKIIRTGIVAMKNK